MRRDATVQFDSLLIMIVILLRESRRVASLVTFTLAGTLDVIYVKNIKKRRGILIQLRIKYCTKWITSKN